MKTEFDGTLTSESIAVWQEAWDFCMVRGLEDGHPDKPADIPKLRDTLAAVPEARRDALRAGLVTVPYVASDANLSAAMDKRAATKSPTRRSRDTLPLKLGHRLDGRGLQGGGAKRRPKANLLLLWVPRQRRARKA